MKLSDMVLGVIDPQPDFMPGGPFAVAAGDRVVAPIDRLPEPGVAAAHPGRAPWPDHEDVCRAIALPGPDGDSLTAAGTRMTTPAALAA